MSENYSSITTPLQVDPTRVIEVKILNALSGSGGGGAGGIGTLSTYTAASGTNPTGIVVGKEGKGAINLTDGGIYWYYNGQWNP